MMCLLIPLAQLPPEINNAQPAESEVNLCFARNGTEHIFPDLIPAQVFRKTTQLSFSLCSKK